MKLLTAVAVLATAFSMTGCLYDKINSKDGDGDSFANGSDINAQSGDINSLGDGAGKFEDLYTRCTDVSFMPVYFELDSTVVPQGELSKIDAVVQHLSDNANRVTVIEGNCDERGSNEYNMSLGENRAIIIRNYLVQNGISADRIQTRSYGEEKPAADGHNEAAWAKNRRGEFAIFQK